MTTASHALERDAQAGRPGTFHERPGFAKRMAASWNAAVNHLVPLGYEDENGFHYGRQSAPHDSVHVNSNQGAAVPVTDSGTLKPLIRMKAGLP